MEDEQKVALGLLLALFGASCYYLGRSTMRDRYRRTWKLSQKLCGNAVNTYIEKSLSGELSTEEERRKFWETEVNFVQIAMRI